MCDVATNTLGTYDSYFNQYVTYKNSYVIIIQLEEPIAGREAGLGNRFDVYVRVFVRVFATRQQETTT